MQIFIRLFLHISDEVVSCITNGEFSPVLLLKLHQRRLSISVLVRVGTLTCTEDTPILVVETHPYL